MKILKQRMLSYSYSLSSALASTLKRMLQNMSLRGLQITELCPERSAPLEAKWNYSSLGEYFHSDSNRLVKTATFKHLDFFFL